jgi:hypothetical protein
MRRINQRIAMGKIKLLIVDVMQKHVDTRKVIGSQIDFLAIESVDHVVFAKHLRELQQQGARATRRVAQVVRMDTRTQPERDRRITLIPAINWDFSPAQLFGGRAA